MTIEKFIKCRVVSTPDHFAEKLRNREVKSEYFLSLSLSGVIYDRVCGKINLECVQGGKTIG